MSPFTTPDLDPPSKLNFPIRANRLCELASSYGAHHVAISALSRCGTHHLSTHAPECLGYACRYQLPGLLAAVLRAFDCPPHGCDCGPCARQKGPHHQLQDVPYRHLSRMPLAVFMRLLRHEAEQTAAPYHASKRWADVAKQVEEVSVTSPTDTPYVRPDSMHLPAIQSPGWFEDSDAFLAA